jgi:AcrR family transcriptional regulator
MVEERKVDRRIQRTRTLLRDALMRLIIRRGYDEITIQDIADEANVARTTFYLHFNDKDDLLFSTMRDVYEELYARVGDDAVTTMFGEDEEDCHAEDFLHVAEFADFYRIMLSERGSAAFLARVRQYLAESIMSKTFAQMMPEGQEPRIPLEIMAYAVAGAQIGVIKWWLEKGMMHSPKRMAFYLEQFIKHGLFWGLNVSETQS